MPMITVTIFGGIIYTLIFMTCVANIINPKWVWEKFESHNAKKEPTKEYFIMRRSVGVIGLIIVSFFILLPLYSYMF